MFAYSPLAFEAKDPDSENTAHFKWILVVDKEVAKDFKAPCHHVLKE